MSIHLRNPIQHTQKIIHIEQNFACCVTDILKDNSLNIFSWLVLDEIFRNWNLTNVHWIINKNDIFYIYKYS